MKMDMRKLYTLALAIALAVSVNAQRIDDQYDFNSIMHSASVEEVEASLRMGAELLEKFQTRGDGNTVFYEDFANGFAGNNGYGEWTVEDSGGGSIWMVADADSPAGEFSTNQAALASETASNGWVIFDADLYNTPIADGVEDTEGWITSPSIDMSELNSVIVEYQQYFRYCCFPFSPMFLEVSNDGGDSWVTFPAHGSFIESANTLSANPLVTTVDVSCVAAGEADVRIRFAYKQNPITGNGYSHYFWGLDDVAIYQNPVESDLVAIQAMNGDIFNVFEYTHIPLEQAITEADGGMVGGMIFRNGGFTDHTNTVVTMEVLNAGGDILSTTTSEPFTQFAATNAPNCPQNIQDTIYLETGWAPTEVGEYIIRTSIVSEVVEGNDENNVIERRFFVTDDEYGHDYDDMWDVELRPRESEDIAGLFDPTGYGSFFHAPNNGTTAYGALVAFGPNSDVETEFELRLYTLDGVPLNDAPFSASFYSVTEEYVPGSIANAEFVYYAFEDPEQLESGLFYFLGLINDFESPGELTVVGNANSDTDNSTGRYNQTGAGDFVWFTSQTSTPAIRLVTSQRTAIDEIANMNGVDLAQNMPNPAADNTIINFQLVSAKTVTFELHDMQGRLVEVRDLGRLPGGEHRLNYNVSDLQSGMYYYSLIVDGVRLTKKMMVSRN